MSNAPNDARKTPLLFDAVLIPNRSLSRGGFLVLIAFFALACCALGTGFYLAGAWPVFGFFGLEILLVWGAFKLSYRAGRLTEVVRLSPEALVVRRIQPSGRMREWCFQPYWLRVQIDDPPQHDSPLILTSHGRRLAIGAFLTAAERHDLARALTKALTRLRSAPAEPFLAC